MVLLLLLWDMWHWLLYASASLILAQLLLLVTVSGCNPGIITKFNKHKYTDGHRVVWTQEDAAGHIYEVRFCRTCKIYKPPLASHCAHCNVCVARFDHHCTLLNKCIGLKNERSFFALLILSYASAVTLVLVGLVFIFYEDMLCHAIRLETGMDVFECVSDAAIVLIMLVKIYAALWWLEDRISFGWQVIGLVAELVLVQGLATTNFFDWALNIAGFLMSIGSSFCLISASLTKRQLNLVSVGMTYKEFLSRQDFYSQVQQEDPRLKEVSLKQRLKNIWNFFFH